MVICDHRKRFIFADSRWPGSTCDTGAVARSRFLTNLFVQRDLTLFPQPYMILADGGFHKRTCFVAPDLPAHNRLESSFNTSISRARCVVENAFGLLKMKWRWLHQHSIAENTVLIPQLILCACVLHNICIDAGDVNAEEDAAVRNDEERLADKNEINAACDRVLRNNGESKKFMITLLKVVYSYNEFNCRITYGTKCSGICCKLQNEIAINFRSMDRCA